MLLLGIGDVYAKIQAIENKLPKISTPFVELAYFANPGIAFSIPLPQSLTLLITGILIVTLSVYLIKTPSANIRIALGTALTGAISNFFDRLITGYTTDYIIFFSRSAINIADLLIVAGMGYGAWYYQKADEKKK